MIGNEMVPYQALQVGRDGWYVMVEVEVDHGSQIDPCRAQRDMACGVEVEKG